MHSICKIIGRPPARRLLTDCLCAVTLAVTGVGTAAGQPANRPKSLGFDSRLWESIYRADPQESQTFAATSDTHQSPVAAIQTQNRLRVVGATAVGSAGSLAALVMNNPSGEDLAENTETTLSDWERHRIEFVGKHRSPATSDGGPTPIIILVGFAAAIVVCGALFSGSR